MKDRQDIGGEDIDTGCRGVIPGGAEGLNTEDSRIYFLQSDF